MNFISSDRSPVGRVMVSMRRNVTRHGQAATGILLLMIGTVAASEPPSTAVSQVSAKTSPEVADETTLVIVQQVFSGDQVDPISIHRLIFDSGVIYEWPQTQSRVMTVYDLAQGNMTLLDQVEKNQTIITNDQLIRFTAGVKAEATAAGQSETLGIGAKVRPSDRVQGYTARFGHGPKPSGKRAAGDNIAAYSVRYDVTTQPAPSPAAAVDFGQFSDASSRLSLLRRRGLPPFARMAISQTLTETGQLPSETFLTIHRGHGPETYRSTTRIERLSREDFDQIANLRGMMTLYRSVSLNDFTNQ